MKVVVFGADGFIGKNVCSALQNNKYEIIRAIYSGEEENGTYKVDISNPTQVLRVIESSKPDVIINCAGIVGAGDVSLNEKFTRNIIEQAAKVGGIQKIFVCGSAGEYGRVDAKNIPVDENTPLSADAGYGLSKLLEEKSALELGKELGLNVIVFRIFNPIGLGMANRFLLTNLLGQINEIKSCNRTEIELSRLDSKRDYIAVSDIASAFASAVNKKNSFNVYNVGSGKATSNGELLDMIIMATGIAPRPLIKETVDFIEPLVANCADISRMKNEFGWVPMVKIDDLIKEICK